MRGRWGWFGLLWCLIGTTQAEALVAVAGNFMAPARELVALFERSSGESVKLSSGSTGSLYAQILHGAPYDVFLAASEREPAQLVAEGEAVSESRYIYALGRLVVWSADPQRVRADCAAVLRALDYRRLAIANPELAPYGAAALAVFESLGIRDQVRPRLLRGENVVQAFQFVATRNAELGVVAQAQVARLPRKRAGSACVVDPAYYPPIRQQAVLLRRASDNATARAFMTFLRGDAARALISRYGYGVGDD